MNDVIKIALEAIEQKRVEEEKRRIEAESKVKSSTDMPSVLRHLRRANVNYRTALKEIFKKGLKSNFFKEAEFFTEMNHICYKKDNVTVKFPTSLLTIIDVLVEVKVDNSKLNKNKMRTNYKVLEIYESYSKGEASLNDVKNGLLGDNFFFNKFMMSEEEVERRISKIKKKKKEAEEHNLLIEKEKENLEIERQNKVNEAKEVLSEDLSPFYEDEVWKVDFKIVNVYVK